MLARILSTFILLSCFFGLNLQAQDNSAQYEVRNTWSSSTEEIEEFPFIVGSSLIQALKINSVAILVKTFPMGKAPNKDDDNASFGGLIAFNKDGLKSFSSNQKVVNWELHRPKPKDKNILVPKKDAYFPIRHGALYYTYPTKNNRRVFFFFEEGSDSLPDRYLNCSVRQSTNKYRSPQHLLPQRVLPKELVNKIVKEDGDAVAYQYEKTKEGVTEKISNDSQINYYNQKGQLIRTYERTSPFRTYVEEYFYKYNKQNMVTQSRRLYEDQAGGFIIQDSTIYEYNRQGQLLKSVRNTGCRYYDADVFKPYEEIHADYYYDSKGLLDRKVISDLTRRVRFVCLYQYNPSTKEIMEMP